MNYGSQAHKSVVPEYLAGFVVRCGGDISSGCCMHNISLAQRMLVPGAMDAGTPCSNPTILMGSSCRAVLGSTAGQVPHHYWVVFADFARAYCHRQSTDGELPGLHLDACD